MTKFAKLSAAGVATAAACVIFIYLFHTRHIQLFYRCLAYATAKTACFGGNPFEFSVDLNGARYQGHTGNYVDKNIFFHGAYEKPVLFFLRDILSTAHHDQGVFLDIGANTGQHSLFLARHAKAIHAFEPWEPVLIQLRRNIEANRLSHIVVHPFGLGNENSIQTFYRPPDNNLGMGSFVKEFATVNSPADKLEIRIGDEVLEKAGVSAVALIKMDIEGFEKLALKGLERTLRQYRPIVEFELSSDPNSPVSVKSRAELLSLFPPDYESLRFSGRSDPDTGAYVLEPLGDALHFDRKEQHDLVAFPVEKKKFIQRQRAVP